MGRIEIVAPAANARTASTQLDSHAALPSASARTWVGVRCPSRSMSHSWLCTGWEPRWSHVPARGCRS